jgi:lysozyme
MNCNALGIKIIKAFEGFRASPYLCAAGVITVGYGSTRGFDNRPISMDMELLTKEDGLFLLRRDLAKSERAVDRLIKVELSTNEFSSLCSFCYNVGSGNLQMSTLRSKLNRGDRDGAADEFPKWRRASGRILAGLVRRREIERQLFLSE